MDGWREGQTSSGAQSVTAVPGICILHRLEQLLSVHELRVGGLRGRQREKTNHKVAFGTSDLHPTTCLRLQHVKRSLRFFSLSSLNVNKSAPLPTNPPIQAENDTGARK